ncbi:MAG: efflux RND transporter permease subunit, partial [Steroidobacteraceae bacterium]|nr:efflux RND transporter permease subunit [Steroidobacteraceae bacterium]MDW8260533.1 efflux RND transporter permease subunit [Gammaproteobacteria bacterium]
VNIELPPGVRLEETARVSDAVRKILEKQPEVRATVEAIGNGEVRNATIYVTLVPPGERAASQDEFEKRITPLLRQIPDARVSFQSFTPGGGKPISFYLVSDHPALLERVAHDVVAAMRAIPELDDPRINGDYQRPELVVTPNLDLAAELGVSVAAIGQTIRIATIGDLAQNAPKFSLADRQIPIRVSLKEYTRQDIDTLENLPVPTASGGSVPLKAVADIRFGQGPTTIRRFDQSRRVLIEAGLKPGVVSGDARATVDALPVLQNLPDGVRKVATGESEVAADIFGNFSIAMAAGILMVFAVMVLLFARVFQPITILSALPLSVGGAILALMIVRQPFSLPVAIGFLMLMGIVGKNSILLVEFAIEEMRAGKDRLTALVESGHKRARPIVMTTVAMVAGMLPIALGLGGDASFNQPMAIAVIGGLITSTALTLVVVPAVFTYIDDFERWLTPRFSRVLTTSTPAANAASAQPAA